jgi:hypothetical protein
LVASAKLVDWEVQTTISGSAAAAISHSLGRAPHSFQLPIFNRSVSSKTMSFYVMPLSQACSFSITSSPDP